MKKSAAIAISLICLLATFGGSAMGCKSGGNNQVADNDGETSETSSASQEEEEEASGALVSEYSAEEQAQFCEGLSERVKQGAEDYKLEEASCYAGALFAIESAGAAEESEKIAVCEEVLAGCLSDPEPTGLRSDICPGDDVLASCEATEEDIHTCIDDMLARDMGPMKELAEETTCADLVDPEWTEQVKAALDALNANADATEIPSCASLQTKCPNFFN